MSGSNATPNDDWVRLNVGGKTFETTKDTLSRHPESFLARLINGGLSSKQDKSGAFLIDRSYEHFDTILNYLRAGSVNFDCSEKAMKDLLCEADFYNIEPLVEQIRDAMSLGINRVESIMLVVEYDSDVEYSFRLRDSFIVCSEENDDYDVLQALRRIFNCTGDNGRYKLEQEGKTMSGANQLTFEIVLRRLGFVQESYDDNYYATYHRKSKCWKFVRTVSK